VSCRFDLEHYAEILEAGKVGGYRFAFFADGPERIEGAWWSEHGGAARDYFRVEDKTGLRFWLFRAGLYRDLAPGGLAPAWFVHGMFA